MLYIGKRVADGGRYEIAPHALTTHGLCVGMTGSGKTGLCIALIEELRLKGIPSIILDPKGDMTNLLLAFPELAPANFAPWVDPALAQREGKTVDQLATETATRWREGLAGDGIGPERIAEMTQRCPVALFTPGSTAGEPLNILGGLATPDVDDPEVQGELIKTAVNALLELIGVKSDPLTGREYILLSNIIDYCWDQKQEATFERIISYVQNPPMKRLGVFAVDGFYPPDRRMELALKLNGLLASPTFRIWMEGTPLSIDSLLADEDGRPRCSVLYLAHLNEAERMFVIALVASRLVAWMHRQPGSEQLRALMFIDEVMGLMPPHPHNPPSKSALITLFKQARAFGLGVVAATQNPMDVDYKVFSNAGLWMIGKLSTDNDRRRVVEGMRGAAGAPENLTEIISGLGKRQFFIRNVRADAPAVIKSRFAMSYLRGPLTKDDISRIAGPIERPTADDKKPEPEGMVQAPVIDQVRNYYLAPEALREPELAAVFNRAVEDKPSTTMLYAPALYVAAQARYDDAKANLVYDETISRVLFALHEFDHLPPFDEEQPPLPDLASFLVSHPLPDSRFQPLPTWLDDAAEFESAERGLVDFIVRKCSLPLFFNPELKLYSRPGESEEHFAERCAQEADEQAKVQLEKLQDKFKSKLNRLEKKRSRLQGKLDDAREETKSRDMESMASVLESAAGFLFGRRRSIGRAVSTNMRRRRMADKVRRRQDQFEEELVELEEDIRELTEEMADNEEKVYDEAEARAGKIEPYLVPPERTDVRPVMRAIIWVPLL